MTEAVLAKLPVACRPAPRRPRLRAVARLSAALIALGLAGEAAAVEVSGGFGIGADVPGVAVADDLTIDRGDPFGVVLTAPVLVGMLRIEPQLSWSDQERDYDGLPPGVHEPCPGLMLCTSSWGEDWRLVLGLSVGPAVSIGERLRLWAGPWGGTTYRAGRQDWSLGAIAGGEVFLDHRLTLGIELRGAYTSVEDGGARYIQDGGRRVPTTVRVDRGWTADLDGLAAFRLYVY